MKKQQVYFVAGTDTDVGKTYASCALLQAAKASGLSTAAFKPVAAGGKQTQAGVQNEDALLLQRACTLTLSYEEINPLCLEQAIAPHIAARQSGITLDAQLLADSAKSLLAKQADLTLIEGAGGWRVPLNDTESMADIVKVLRVPVILVVGMRLGCLNHALLTVEAIQEDGLELHGWIANQLDSKMSVYQENIATLESMIAAPLLASFSWQQAEPEQAIDLKSLLELS